MPHKKQKREKKCVTHENIYYLVDLLVHTQKHTQKFLFFLFLLFKFSLLEKNKVHFMGTENWNEHNLCTYIICYYCLNIDVSINTRAIYFFTDVVVV